MEARTKYQFNISALKKSVLDRSNRKIVGKEWKKKEQDIHSQYMCLASVYSYILGH